MPQAVGTTLALLIKAMSSTRCRVIAALVKSILTETVMNISMQLVRGLGALAMCAAVSAYALTQPAAPDAQEVAVAHSRLEIVAVNSVDASDTDAPARYQVVSVRVGEPVPLRQEPMRRVAQRTTWANVAGG
jgi:hypothetical protein